MAETSKSFWGKFKKTNLKPFHHKLPIDLIEMFPEIEEGKLYNIYHLKCNDSINETAEYLTRDQPGNFIDEIPIDVLIESLKSSTKDLINTKNNNVEINDKPNYFDLTPTHVLRHIFSFNGPMTLGKITRLNRECRLLSKSLLSKITQYDFSYFYHNYCQNRPKSNEKSPNERTKIGKRGKRQRRNKNKNNKRRRTLSNYSNMIIDDDVRLISHINAFQYLESLSLRSTYFSKWYSFRSILNKMNIKYLNLNSSLNLYDDDIGIIIETFPSLEIVDLSNCIEITDLAMTNIIEYGEMNNNLHTIILNNTPQITKYGVKQLINYKKCIINLEWKGAKYGNVTACFENAKHMKSLNLSTNDCLEQLILTLDNKKSWLDLNLSNCVKLRFLDLKITHLRSLNVTQCIKLREIRVSHTFEFKKLNCKSCKILQLLAIPSKAVEMIGLSGCNALNLELLFHQDNFLMASLKCGKLTSLDLSHIHNITNDNLQEILDCNKLHGNPLQALSLNECKLISNQQIKSICKDFETPKIESQRVQKRRQRARKSRKYST